MKYKKSILELAKCIFIALTFFAVDFSLRYFTRWLGYYSIFELPPSLFSLCWIAVFLVVLSLFPRKTGRVVYAVLYGTWAVYAVAQYIYYLIFDNFFFLMDIRNAGEGKSYLDYVLGVLNWKVFFILGFFLAIGIAGFVLFPDFKRIETRPVRNLLRGGLAICSCLGMLLIPSLYTDNEQALFFSSKYEYKQFTNPGFDLEISGLFHYVARDAWCTYLKPQEDHQLQYAKVDTYLQSKNAHANNKLTGALSGKNLILVQMESIDDWVLTEGTMPTVSRMMQEGINFNNMYTCLYGSGWTFSTEFAFNAGVYQSTKGVAAYSMRKNIFPYSVANLLKENGYECTSFHQNTGNFYSRSSIHPALGYEQYVCTSSLVSPEFVSDSDISMIADDTCWEMMTEKPPFCNFIITYGAHVPYSSDNPLVQYALNTYPEYDIKGRDPELNAIYAKARTLDDMFACLLERLEADGLLQNTAIIAYTDHYCYGLSDKDTVHKLSEANGSSILERTPAFIWYEGCESMEVDKVCQTVDWVPTIANLFGMDVTPYVIGNDIFDDAYEGYAIFPGGTWLTDKAYVVNGVPQWSHDITPTQVEEMNAFVQKFYQANEAILESNYYARTDQKHN